MISHRPPSAPRGPRRSYEALQLVAFWGIPLLLTYYVIHWCVQRHTVATDFHHEFWPAARLVIHGLSPYAPGWQHVSAGVAFPYPALTALVFVPLALLPHGVADGLFTALNIAAVLLTLRALEIRDRRVYGVVLMWPMVVEAWQAANLTLLLGLGIAWLWRERDRPLVAGALVAVLVSLKPFVWPLGLWLLATRRYAALAYAIVAGLVVNALAWAVLGFDQVRAYDSVVQAVTNVMYKRGYDIAALLMHLGTGHAVAYAIGVVVGGVAAIACVYFGLRGNEQAALALAIALSLLATPVLWTHYFALMIIPLALARPRLSSLWFLPLLLWVCPVNPAPWQAVLALAVNAAIVAVTVLRRGSGKAGHAGSAAVAVGSGAQDASRIPALAVK